MSCISGFEWKDSGFKTNGMYGLLGAAERWPDIVTCATVTPTPKIGYLGELHYVGPNDLAFHLQSSDIRPTYYALEV